MCNQDTETTQSTNQSSMQKVTPTAQEQQFLKTLQGQYSATSGNQTGLQNNLINLANALATGNLSGPYSKLTSGISSDAIAKSATNYALNALPSFQALGLTDSGTAAQNIASGIATDILLPAEEYNTTMLSNLLNTAFTGGSTASNLVSNTANTLASSLAGLRGVSTTGTTTGTTTQTSNPFLTSFYSSLGSGLGSGITGSYFG